MGSAGGPGCGLSTQQHKTTNYFLRENNSVYRFWKARARLRRVWGASRSLWGPQEAFWKKAEELGLFHSGGDQPFLTKIRDPRRPVPLPCAPRWLSCLLRRQRPASVES
jgi:hypothetical protein